MTSTGSTGRNSSSSSAAVDTFPTMLKCVDLMAMVQAGPEVLELRSIVKFPVHKRDAPTLDDFLRALQTNTTITNIRCSRHFTTGFNDDEWCRILLAFGTVHKLQTLVFVDGGDSRLRRLRIDLVTNIVQSARRIRHLTFGKSWLLMGNDAHRHGLAAALTRHATLVSFSYAGCGLHTQLYQSIAPRSNPNAILQALKTCRRLQSICITNSPYCANDYSGTCLIELLLGPDSEHADEPDSDSSRRDSSQLLQSLTIVTRPSNWRLLGSALHQCRSLERLTLIHSGREDARTAEAIIALLQHLSHHTVHLRHLALHICGNSSSNSSSSSSSSYAPLYVRRSGLDQTDQRLLLSEVMADAIRRNTTLRVLELTDDSEQHGYQKYEDSTMCSDENDSLPAQRALPCYCRYQAPTLYQGERCESWETVDFERLAEAVRDNSRMQVYVGTGLSETNTKLQEAYNRLCMESMLNAVGRYRSTTTLGDSTDDVGTGQRDERESCLGSMTKLNDLSSRCPDEGGLMLQSCWYELVRSHPLLCCRQ